MNPIPEDQSLVEIARHHPESGAKVIRAGLHEDQSREANQASILMISLGRETAAGIMKYMMDTEIEIVAHAMAGRDVVTPEERDAVQNDVKSRILSGTHLDYGGADYTSEVLEMAMGPRKARAFMDRAIPNSPSTRPLMNMDPNVITPFLAKEHPQTIALILSQLDPKKTMAILEGFGEALPRPVRIVSWACAGPMETSTISCAVPASFSRSASSTAISSNGFIDILTLARSTPDPSALTRTLTL